MHGLGHVGAAVIDDHPAGFVHQRRSGARVGRDLVDAVGQGRVGNPQVDEPEARDLDRGQVGIVLQRLDHLHSDVARRPPRDLGGGHGAVALEVREVGPVGCSDPPELRGQACGDEGGGDGLAQRPLQVRHRPPV